MAEHYGLEIAKAAKLPTGTIYPILARLEEAGCLVSEWEQVDPAEEGRPRRRYYRLTAPGERFALEQPGAVINRGTPARLATPRARTA